MVTMPSTLFRKPPKYEQLCYVFQPVKPGEYGDEPYIFCVHNNHLTDGGNCIGEDWQTRTSPLYKLEHAEVIRRCAHINEDDLRGMIMQTGRQVGCSDEVKAGRLANDVAFKEQMRRRLDEWVPPAPNPKVPREGEADIYEVKLLSHWPETLNDPDAEPGSCRVM